MFSTVRHPFYWERNQSSSHGPILLLFSYYPRIYSQVFQRSFMVLRPTLYTHFSLFPLMLHAQFVQSSLIYHPNNILWLVKIMKRFFMKYIQHLDTTSLLYPNIPLTIMFSNTVNRNSSLNQRDQDSHA